MHTGIKLPVIELKINPAVSVFGKFENSNLSTQLLRNTSISSYIQVVRFQLHWHYFATASEKIFFKVLY
jgi:hypothetical protein